MNYPHIEMTFLFFLLLCTVLNCCEGDILLLLDSSGSVANYEFSRMLDFAAELLRPFSLGRGHVRIGLLEVGTNPNLEFGLDVHDNQGSLQKALRSVRQLQGDTNTEAALGVAQRLLSETDENVPKIESKSTIARIKVIVRLFFIKLDGSAFEICLLYQTETQFYRFT